MECAGPCRLKLAQDSVDWNDSSSWAVQFGDFELTVSLHRWNWLLTGLTEETPSRLRSWGLGLMRDWLRTMGRPSAGLAWDSYTTGERISNAILFLALTGEQPRTFPLVPDDLAWAVGEMARHLVGRLEYQGPDWSGNHVLNNARALCFAGLVLGDPAYTDLALAMLSRDLPRLVTRDGFLREGSSHYHFLVTRWLLEVLWVAEAGAGGEIGRVVRPFAAAMVQRCWFFPVFQRGGDDWVMPLIGDVSPDFTWRWLLDLPWSSMARRLYAPEPLPPRPCAAGWGALMDRLGEPAACGAARAPSRSRRFEAFFESGWYRLEWDGMTAFWHAEPAGAPAFVSHGHCDIGSFCLYWNGMEILVDPGRLNYREDDLLGTYGISARAHNSLLIDGFEPFIYRHRGRYPDLYRTGTVQVSWVQEDEEFRLSVQHTGFSRLHGDRIVFYRTFKVRRACFAIEDRIEGEASHAITTSFHWAPRIVLLEEGRGGRFGVQSEAGSFRGSFSTEPVGPEGQAAEPGSRIVRGCTTPYPGGWYFPEYGEKIGTTSLIYECRAKLPYARRYILEWNV
ncbi:MAG: heparinase II/III family protein [Candidatus Eremiobacterota bacterium]